MTNLPPFGFVRSEDHFALMQENAKLRAKIAALEPRETLEQVARREADLIAGDADLYATKGDSDGDDGA